MTVETASPTLSKAISMILSLPIELVRTPTYLMRHGGYAGEVGSGGLKWYIYVKNEAFRYFCLRSSGSANGG